MKITVFGAGKVGSTAVQLLAYRNLGDIVLHNRTLETAQGLVLDLMESSPILKFRKHVKATNDYKDTKDSDIVIITAGMPRKEGMSRDDLLNKNASIIKDIAVNAAKHSPNAFFIVVTNPLDAMVYAAMKAANLRRERIVGMAGTLDTARFAYFIADELCVPSNKVDALVLGSHGDLMVPAVSQTRVRGKPLTKVMEADKISKIVERTRNGGAEIINLMKSSAFYATAASIVQVVEAVIKHQKKAIPCSVYLKGEYGIKDTFAGVPVVFGRKGVQRVIKLKLTDQEINALRKSADAVKELIGRVNL